MILPLWVHHFVAIRKCEFWILVAAIMCPNRDLFSSFEELDFNIALMSNGHSCETLGIGKIRLCMMYPPLICLMFDMSQT